MQKQKEEGDTGFLEQLELRREMEQLRAQYEQTEEEEARLAFERKRERREAKLADLQKKKIDANLRRDDAERLRLAKKEKALLVELQQAEAAEL